MSLPNANQLLVEGEDEKRVIPFFMDHFITWGDTRNEWPVEIQAFNGIDDMIKPGIIEAKLKTSGLESLGIVADANDKLAMRWSRIRERAIKTFPNLPVDFPEAGLISTNPDGLRFGVWLMPDNKQRGMLETFLAYFIPTNAKLLWNFAQSACAEAKTHGAPYKDAHIDKVRIHTWLAFQDPPGQSLNLAVQTKVLTIGSPNSDSFVTWFRTLYGL